MYTYSIDGGETWSETFSPDIAIAKYLGTEEYHRDVSPYKAFTLKIGTVKLPIEILNDDREWMLNIVYEIQEALAEAMPFCDCDIMQINVKNTAELANVILRYLSAKATFNGFLVENIIEYNITPMKCEEK